MIDSADARVVELSPHGRRRRRRALGEGRPDRGVGGQEPQGQELQGRVRPRQRGLAPTSPATAPNTAC